MDAARIEKRAAVLAGESRWQELLEFLDAQRARADCLASADLAYRVGEALYHLGRMDELADHAAAFERTARNRRDVPAILRALNLRGIAAFELGHTPEARDAFETLMALAEAEGDQDMLARACLNLGAVANLVGDPATALTLYHLALPLFQKLGQIRGQSQTHQSLALSYRDSGRYDDADDAYREAIRLGLELGYLPIVSMGSIGRAELLMLRDDPRAALGLVEWGLRLARRLEDPITEGTGLRVRARARAALGREAEARQDLQVALDVARQTGNRLLEAETLRDLGQVALQSGETPTARTHWELAAEQLLRMGAAKAAETLSLQLASLPD